MHSKHTFVCEKNITNLLHKNFALFSLTNKCCDVYNIYFQGEELYKYMYLCFRS